MYYITIHFKFGVMLNNTKQTKNMATYFINNCFIRYYWQNYTDLSLTSLKYITQEVAVCSLQVVWFTKKYQLIRVIHPGSQSTTLVVLYGFDLLKRTHNSQSFGSRATLVELNVFIHYKNMASWGWNQTIVYYINHYKLKIVNVLRMRWRKKIHLTFLL